MEHMGYVGIKDWSIQLKTRFRGRPKKSLLVQSDQWNIPSCIYIHVYMLSEVSINGGTPKWMVYNVKSQSKMDDLGVPSILGNFYIYILVGT